MRDFSPTTVVINLCASLMTDATLTVQKCIIHLEGICLDEEQQERYLSTLKRAQAARNELEKLAAALQGSVVVDAMLSFKESDEESIAGQVGPRDGTA
jgi:hypothetical protein